MLIGGLQPVTLLDYPEKVAAIIFTARCNMRCPFCYNSNLVLPEKIEKVDYYKEEDILKFFDKRKKLLDGVVITGGEPTLQADLGDFCLKLKEMGYKIKLDTNGLLPEVVEKLISKGLIDYIAMDIKGPLSRYSEITRVEINSESIKKSVKLIMSSGLGYEFRTTLVKGLHELEAMKEIGELIKGADKYYLQSFTPGQGTLEPGFNGSFFTVVEMTEFKEITDKYVKVCKIR